LRAQSHDAAQACGYASVDLESLDGERAIVVHIHRETASLDALRDAAERATGMALFDARPRSRAIPGLPEQGGRAISVAEQSLAGVAPGRAYLMAI
jgi:hypothetical protein